MEVFQFEQEEEKEEELEENEVILAVRELRDRDGDILMKDEIPYDNSWKEISQEGVLLILDTNILISYLPLLDSFIKLLNSIIPTTQNLPILTIPHIVLRELDGLKSSSRSTEVSESTISSTSNGNGRKSQRSISNLARDATSWLLKMHPSPSDSNAHPQRALVRGQRINETLTSERSIEGGGGNNDDKILDCARFYKEKEFKRVILISNDKNLCLKARIEGVNTLMIDDNLTDLKLLGLVDPSISLSTTSNSNNSSTTTTTTTTKKSKSIISIHSTPIPPRLLTRPLPPPSLSLPQLKLNSNSMETTLTNPPSFTPLPAPLLHPITSYHSIILNLNLILQQFLSCSLASHLYHYLSTTAGRVGKEREWQEFEIFRNWKEWTGRELVLVTKEWWEDGKLRELCQKGLDRIKVEEEKVVKKEEKKIPQKNNNSGISRWASTSSTPIPPTIKSLSSPSPLLKAVISTSQRLKNLQSSFPRLLIYLDTSSVESRNWSVPKIEIVLEELEEFLIVLLSGLMGLNLERDVKQILEDWLRELREI